MKYIVELLPAGRQESRFIGTVIMFVRPACADASAGRLAICERSVSGEYWNIELIELLEFADTI
jgi:hypothetical protein